MKPLEGRFISLQVFFSSPFSLFALVFFMLLFHLLYNEPKGSVAWKERTILECNLHKFHSLLAACSAADERSLIFLLKQALSFLSCRILIVIPR